MHGEVDGTTSQIVSNQTNKTRTRRASGETKDQVYVIKTRVKELRGIADLLGLSAPGSLVKSAKGGNKSALIKMDLKKKNSRRKENTLNVLDTGLLHH